MPMQLDPNRQINTPGGEGVLANFFNSLLNKKTGTPGSTTASLGSAGGNLSANQMSTPLRGSSGLSSLNGTGTPPDSLLSDKHSVRNDAAAELERLTRTAAASSVKREMDFSQSDC